MRANPFYFCGRFLSNRMASNQAIEHMGYVTGITNTVVEVTIAAQSACASCHAKGACSVSETENKIIEVPHHGEQFRQGELVRVKMSSTMGFQAVFLGYILPFLLILTGLIIAGFYTSNEAILGLTALGLLPFYYGILYLVRHRIREHFTFSIEKTV